MANAAKLSLSSLFWVGLALVSNICTAQKLIVKDTKSGQPISQVTVTIDGIPQKIEGEGPISVSTGAHTVGLRAIGYRPRTMTVDELRKASFAVTLEPLNVHALYLTEYGIASAALREPVLRIIQSGGANALVITIKSDRGTLAYPSDIPLARSVGAAQKPTIRSLPSLVRELHERNIYLIARIVTFKDEPLAHSRPDLAVRTPGGTLYRDREHLAWTDPFKDEVRHYNIAVAVEAAKAGFDEIQFDYVRFPDYSQKLQFSQPTSELARVNAISTFLREARSALAPFNVFLSVDVFGYVTWNTSDTGIGQRLEDITGIVDYVCPMLYPSGFKYGIPGHRSPLATNDDIYQTIKLSLNEAEKRTSANPKKFRPWIQGFRDYAFTRREFHAPEIATQTSAAAAAGASGWSLWNARNVYSDSGLDH
jgi:hypothetical protein